MMDPDRNRQREHWQAIAEQLGLGPESEQSSASHAKPEPPPVRREEEPVAEASVPLAKPGDVPEEEPRPRRGRRGRSTRADKGPERREKPSPRPSEGPGVKKTGTEAARPAEEEPRRGRGRRPARASTPPESEGVDPHVGAEAP